MHAVRTSKTDPRNQPIGGYGTFSVGIGETRNGKRKGPALYRVRGPVRDPGAVDRLAGRLVDWMNDPTPYEIPHNDDGAAVIELTAAGRRRGWLSTLDLDYFSFPRRRSNRQWPKRIPTTSAREEDLKPSFKKEPMANTETLTFTATGSRSGLARFRGLLALLHWAGRFGHTGIFAMPLDGDGPDVLTIDPEPGNRDAAQKIFGIGYDVEVSYDNVFSGLFQNRKRKAKWDVQRETMP